MFKKYQLKSYNFRLAVIVILTTIYGIIIINSADSYFTLKQSIGLVMGIVIMGFLSFVDYHWILRFYWVIYFFNILLLLVVKIMPKSSHGAARWIDLGFFQLQPSELSKIFLILFTAKILSSYKDKINNLKFLALLAVILGIPLLLIVSQPDLSTTILIFLVLFSLIYTTGLSYKIIGTALLIIVPIVTAFFIYISNPDNKLFFLEDYQRERILTFLNPESNEDGEYQQEYSVKAIGSGKLSGKGLNNDEPSSLKNANYIAEAQNDFIFAVIGEELGFLGCCLALLMLAWIVFECILAAIRAKDFVGKLICIGVASYIAFQSFINIGVVTRLLPNTGLPLPFFSYGLTSLLTLFISIGIVLNISLQRNVLRDDEIFAKDFKG